MSEEYVYFCKECNARFYTFDDFLKHLAEHFKAQRQAQQEEEAQK